MPPRCPTRKSWIVKTPSCKNSCCSPNSTDPTMTIVKMHAPDASDCMCNKRHNKHHIARRRCRARKYLPSYHADNYNLRHATPLYVCRRCVRRCPQASTAPWECHAAREGTHAGTLPEGLWLIMALVTLLRLSSKCTITMKNTNQPGTACHGGIRQASYQG